MIVRCLKIALLLGCFAWMNSTIAAADDSNGPEVRVALRIEYRPELKFDNIRELQRLTVGWSPLVDHTTAETAQVTPNQEVAKEMIRQWEVLLHNNPVHQTLVSAASEVIAEESIASRCDKKVCVAKSEAVPMPPVIQFNDFRDFDPIESDAAELEAEAVVVDQPFELDPYGYDEYNCYIEETIYDSYVFVTDDLTVVYYDDAPEMDKHPKDVVLKPLLDLILSQANSLKSELIGAVGQMTVVYQGVYQPFRQRYVAENPILQSKRFAELNQFLRF